LGAHESALDGWNQYTAQRDGEDVGIVITKGPEIHMVSLSDKKAMTRKNITAFIAPLLDLYGYVTTKVPIAEEDHRLRTVLGFTCTWTDATFSYWCLTELPFTRKS